MPENNRKGAHFQGHFICLGRWGSPTQGEINAGVPHNGQASNTWWDLVNMTEHTLVMNNKATMDGLSIRREVIMDEDSPVCYVTEKVKNYTSTARLSNIVQHVTIGTPFLDTGTVINTNATHGFNQKFAYPDPSAHEYVWPDGINDASLKSPVNLTSTNNNENYCTTHLLPGKYGWVSALNPKQGLLLGYVWKTNDYPWLNIWQHVKDGRPIAKGLEFGTTGIGKPYQALLDTCTQFYGHNSYEFHDAGEVIEKSFLGFLLMVPSNCESVNDIEIKDNTIIISSNTILNKIKLDSTGSGMVN
jgi:hypothetical protein